MFYDKSKIYVKGGDGGNGCMAFRREKYVPEGGPWGGDGGRGGDVIFTADEGLRTLVDFRYQRHYKAGRGQHGMGKNMHGRTGEDLVLKVPVGTVVREAETGRFIGDLTANGQELVVARGGRGGRGNARFATMINKAPRMAENGEPGEELWLSLELKLLADVGLVGLPNAGKSSLITSVSAARPKIADYPFTTIVPNLGMVRVDEGSSFVVADIPGLIEGAHTGTGLGHEFLRHVERTRVLVHVVDISVSSGNPFEDFEVINRELSLYNPGLAEKPMIVAANKIDLPDAKANLDLFAGQLGNKYEIYPISALTGEGVDKLVTGIARLLARIPAGDGGIMQQEEEVVVHKVGPRFTVEKKDGVFTVSGREIERHLAMTNLDNEEALGRLQRIMSIMGIDKALSRAGAKNGDTVVIKNFEFEYTE